MGRGTHDGRARSGKRGRIRAQGMLDRSLNLGSAAPDHQAGAPARRGSTPLSCPRIPPRTLKLLHRGLLVYVSRSTARGMSAALGRDDGVGYWNRPNTQSAL